VKTLQLTGKIDWTLRIGEKILDLATFGNTFSNLIIHHSAALIMEERACVMGK
jgi:hypothetical protein